MNDGQDYTYSVVGLVPDPQGDGFTLVNTYGWVRTNHAEYARRYGVNAFKKSFPGARVELAGAALMDRTRSVRLQISP